MTAPAKVLIVDDEATLVKVFARILQQAGYEVRTAASAEAGLELARREPCAVVLLDNNLGSGMVGTRAVVEFSRVATAGVIMMTGHPIEGLAEDAKLLGAKGFLQKPVEAADLLKAVAAVLAGL